MRDLPAAATFTRAEARELGWTDSALNHAVRIGRIRRVRHGVLAPVPISQTDLWRADDHVATASAVENEPAVIALAAARACRGSVVSHTSAAVLHGLPLLGQVPMTPTVTVGPRGTGDLAHAHLHRATLWDDDVVDVGGTAVTSVARTVVDLARALSRAAAVVTTDAALQRALTDYDAIEQVLGRCRSWPGAPRARRAIAASDARAESPLESVSRLALSRLRLPVPTLQQRIFDARGRHLARVDFYWDDVGVVGEADGQAKYGLSSDSLIREKARQERLEDLGLVVIRWGWSQLRQPAILRTRICAAFDRGRARDRSGFPRKWSLR